MQPGRNFYLRFKSLKMPFMAKRLGLHRLTEVLDIAAAEWPMRWTELAIFRRHVIADLMNFSKNVLLISEVLIYNRL